MDTHEIEKVIRRYGEFAHGGSAEAAANEWALLAFTADEVDAWLAARCFDADAASALRQGGYTPEQASALTDEGLGEYTDTIGYKVSNGDLDVSIAEGDATRYHDPVGVETPRAD